LREDTGRAIYASTGFGHNVLVWTKSPPRCLLLGNANRDGTLGANLLTDLAAGAEAQEERRYGPVFGRLARLSPVTGIDREHPLWALIQAIAALLRGAAFLLVPRYLHHGITTRWPVLESRSCPAG